MNIISFDFYNLPCPCFLNILFTTKLVAVVTPPDLRLCIRIVWIYRYICTRSKNLVSVSAGILNFVAIKLLKIVYRYIALWLTQWENPRAKTDYPNSLVLEMFWFEFFITYSSIFYVALSKNATFVGTPGRCNWFTTAQFRFEGCSEQTCF